MITTLMFISKYEDYLWNLIPVMNSARTKICYVTFNKSGKYLKDYFSNNGLNKEIFFIDCNSGGSQNEFSGCEYMDSSNLEEIGSTILKRVEQGYNFIVIDSISNFLKQNPYLYDDNKRLREFIKYLSKNSAMKNGEVLFICREEDKTSEFVQGALDSFNIYKTSIGYL